MKGNELDFVDQLTGHAPYRRRNPMSNGNILLITTDMVPPEFWRDGPTRRIIRTPNLDSLENDGVTFQNAFATSPVCAPSRAAYLTGRQSYITTNNERGHDGHEVHLRPSDTIFPEYLRAIGYHVRHIGKSHVGTEKFIDAFGENDTPWNRWSPPWYDDDRYVEYLRHLGLDRLSFSRCIHGRHPSGDGKGNFYGGWIADQDAKPFPLEATYPWYLVERAISTLDARENRDTPFYLQLDFFGPHQPFSIPAGFEQREAELRQKLKLPDSYHELLANGFNAPWVEPRVYELYRRNWGMRDPEVMLDYMVANMLQYEVIDAALGHLLAHLRKRCLYENTSILYTADHGEMNGENGLIDKGAFLNPQVLRVPLVLKPAADCRSHTAAAGTHVSRDVSLIDIAPTILELAGVEPMARLDGVSLFRSAEDMPRESSKPVMAEIWSHVVPNPTVAIIFSTEDHRRYLFAFNATDALSELYRLDPYEPTEGETVTTELVNLLAERGTANEKLLNDAVLEMETVLAGDDRWKGYLAFFRLVFADHFADSEWESQNFE